MPSHLQTAFLGFLTLRILNGIPQDQAGWIIKALARWIIAKEEPKTEEIPAECLGSWIAIREESVSIADRKKELAAFGRSGGRPASKPTENQPEKAPDESQGKPTKADEKPTKANPKPTQSQGKQDRDRDRDRDISSVSSLPETEAEAPVCVGAPAREAVAGKPASDSASDSVSVFTKIFAEDPARAIAMTPDEHLVAVTMRIIGEPTNARMRGRIAKFRRLCGADELRDILTAFAAEIAAGEVPANAGATFNARLTAREAILGNS